MKNFPCIKDDCLAETHVVFIKDNPNHKYSRKTESVSFECDNGHTWEVRTRGQGLQEEEQE